MTFAIHRYPTHLIDVVRLANGSRVTIRPTLPQDAELQREFFLCLFAKSRYSRFMTWLNELPEALLERFTSIDYCNHLALLAEVFEDGRETMIGEARYIVDERDPETCEFAVSVALIGKRVASPSPSSTDDVTGHQILHCGRGTAARHMRNVRPGRVLKMNAGEVSHAARAGAALRRLAWVHFQPRDKFLQVLRGHVLRNATHSAGTG
jgi:hypothetical protein